MSHEPFKFTLIQRANEKKENTFMFVSATPKTGTTYTCIKSAQLLTEYAPELKIAVLDANDMHPEISRRYGDPDEGWTSLDQVDFENPLESLDKFTVKGYNKLTVIPLGKNEGDRKLRPEAYQYLPTFFNGLKSEFGLLLIDGPPILNSTSSLFLARIVNGVILVLEAGKTRRQLVHLALDQLKDAGANVIGTIMNKREFYIPAWIYRRLF